MDYNASWQRLISTSCNAATFGWSGHYTSIAAYKPTFRSVWWRILLGVLPKDSAQWQQLLRQQRSEYEEIRHRLSVTPGITEETEDLCLNNPLSQDSQSSWNQYFEDSELKRLIRQDVERTFPEERFFHTPILQETMVAILFCYARQHQQIGFKQGQHEVLAPLLLALHTDHQEYEMARTTGHLVPLVQEMMDPAYLEHDAYWLLCGVMGRLSKWYLSRDNPPPPPPALHQQLLHGQPFAETAAQSPTENPSELSPLLARIQRIHGTLLPATQPRLAAHLSALDIPPQVYAIRWLRLLFGREFALSDLPRVWDALFWVCEEDDLPLVDYVALALLESVQGQLLAGDYLSCLNLLMRFPRPPDTDALLSSALSAYTSARHKGLNSNRQRHNSSSEPTMTPSSSYSSLPPTLRPQSARLTPASLPPLDLSVNTPSSNAAGTTRTVPPLDSCDSMGQPSSLTSSRGGGGVVQSNGAVVQGARTRTASGGSLCNGASVQRVHSLHGTDAFGSRETVVGAGLVRSRSQVTRCASEGGGAGARRGGRHPSASPRRTNADQVVTYSAQRDSVEAETTSSHKSNLLNFVKFGTVKFNKPRESPTTPVEPPRTDGVGGRPLQEMSRGGRRAVPASAVTTTAAAPTASVSRTTTTTTAAAAGAGATTAPVMVPCIPSQQDTRQLGDILQRLAGEFSGHLSALGLRHQQLRVDGDLSVRVAMDSLNQVSRSLQDAADRAEVGECGGRSAPQPTSPRSPPSPHSTSSSHSGPVLHHPLQASPD